MEAAFSGSAAGDQCTPDRGGSPEMKRIETSVREGGIVRTRGCCGDASRNMAGWKPPGVATCWGVKPSSHGAGNSPSHVLASS